MTVFKILREQLFRCSYLNAVHATHSCDAAAPERIAGEEEPGFGAGSVGQVTRQGTCVPREPGYLLSTRIAQWVGFLIAKSA